jgi:hypothetical protein
MFILGVASVFVVANNRLLRRYRLISGESATKYAYETYATPTVLRQWIVISC